MGALLTVDECFFRWEQNRRCSFYLTRHSMPLFHAFAEDDLLEEVAPGTTQYTCSVAIEPRLTVRISGPIAQTYFGSLFRNGCKGLQSYVLKAGASPLVGQRKGAMKESRGSLPLGSTVCCTA